MSPVSAPDHHASATNFSSKERWVAGALENVPWLRNAIRNAYKRVVYATVERDVSPCTVRPGITMLTPAQWAGCADQPRESHFFGYYDKCPWNPSMTHYLMHRIRGERAEVVMFDRVEHEVSVLGSTLSWNWQQGAMTQWFPAHDPIGVIYNNAIGNTLGSTIYEIFTGDTHFVPWPIQALHPCRRRALSLNYRRLFRLRRCYGYELEFDNFSPTQSMDRDGIWDVNLLEGKGELIISLSQLAGMTPSPRSITDHKVNHCLYSPCGTQFAFLHRYFRGSVRFSRLLVADTANPAPRVLLDNKMVSHYGWVNEHTLVVWARTPEFGDRYYLVDTNGSPPLLLGCGILDRHGDGHCTCFGRERYILTDSYPDKARMQRLMLFDRDNDVCAELGRFRQPWAFDGDNRCDLHPRISPDGTCVSIDSAHLGIRGSYILQMNSPPHMMSTLPWPSMRTNSIDHDRSSIFPRQES